MEQIRRHVGERRAQRGSSRCIQTCAESQPGVYPVPIQFRNQLYKLECSQTSGGSPANCVEYAEKGMVYPQLRVLRFQSSVVSKKVEMEDEALFKSKGNLASVLLYTDHLN